jgi:tetratricopeptide (TPR) repeat protein
MKHISVVIGLMLMSIPFLSADSQISRARTLIIENKGQDAIEELRSIIALSPKSAEAWGLLGQAFALTGQNDSAVIAGRKAIQSDGDMVEGYVAVSMGEAAKKNFADAYKVIYSGLKKKKFNPVLLTQLGNVHVLADSIENAIIAYSQAKEADPNNYLIHERLGDAYMRQAGGSSMAAIEYDKATKLDSMRTSVYYKLSQALQKDRRYDDAADALIRIAEIDKTDTKAVFEVARLFFRGKVWSKAAYWFAEYLKRAPESTEAQSFYMEALYNSKQYPAAIAQAEKVLAATPQAKLPLRIIAHSNFETNNYQAAIDFYLKFKAVDTLGVLDLKRMSRAYLEMKSDSLAILPLEEILARDPSTTDILSLLGSLYIKTRQYDKASSLYAKQLDRDPDNQQLIFQYVTTNFSLKNWQAADSMLKKLVARQPDNIQAHFYLAKAYSYEEKGNDAMSEYQTVIKLAGDSTDKYLPQLVESYALIGMYHLMAKRYPSALQSLNESIKLKNDVQQYRLWRAQALILSGKQPEAEKEYEATIKLDPSSDAAKTARDDLKKIRGKSN